MADFVRPTTRLKAQNSTIIGAATRKAVGVGVAVALAASVAGAGGNAVIGNGVLVPSAASVVGLGAVSQESATKIVRKDGGGDFTDPVVAIASAVAGDVIEIQNVVPGVGEIFTGSVVCSGHATINNMITVRVRPGDVCTFTAGNSNNTTWRFQSASYWDVEGLILGDESEWTPLSTSDPHGGWSAARQLVIDSNSHHIRVRKSTMTGAQAGSQPNLLDSGAHHLLLEDCTVWKHGTNFDQRTPSAGDTGDMMVARADHVLWNRCTFMWGGHDMVVVLGNYHRFYDCFMDNNQWVSIHGNTSVPGARALNINAGKSNESGVNAPNGYISIRKCHMINPGPGWNDGGGVIGQRTMDAEGRFVVIYDSMFTEDEATAGTCEVVFGHSSPSSDPMFTDNYHVFNNVVWGADHLHDGNDSGRSNTGQAGDSSLITGGPMYYVNNGVQNLSSANGVDKRWGGYAQLTEVEAHFSGVDGWLEAYHDTNIFYRDGGGTVNVRAEYPNGNVISRTLAQAEIDWSAHFVNNQTAEIDYVDETLRTRLGFQINSGVGIGTAREHGRMVGGGASSTNITITNPIRFFCGNSYELDEFGSGYNAENDYIIIGSNAAVELLTMDLETGVGTIATPLNWNNNDAVVIAGVDRVTPMADVGIGVAA